MGQLISPFCIQRIEFSLPDANENLSASVELVWRDVQRRMGVRFAGKPPEANKTLQAWVEAYPAWQRWLRRARKLEYHGQLLPEAGSTW